MLCIGLAKPFHVLQSPFNDFQITFLRLVFYPKLTPEHVTGRQGIDGF
ncbi:hypothetical protein PMI42_05078 [Bradyrhizobium sp. YR681]|nr:hypothetical protein PMI42_05078 [Bradyrhizobium sp. YR681]